MEKTAEIIAKYQRWIDNVKWNLKTNKPTDKMELQKCHHQINDYTEMIVDLKTVASKFKHPVPDGNVFEFTKNDIYRAISYGTKRDKMNAENYVSVDDFVKSLRSKHPVPDEAGGKPPSQLEGDGRLKIQATEIVESFEPMCLKYEDAAKKCAILHYELMIDEESVDNISIHGIERIKHYKELIKTIKSL